MSPEPAILVQHLEKRYGERRALRDLNLALPQGSTLVVFGANGAGKTTLLRILALLERPTSGNLSILGRDPREEGDDIRSRLGFISHQPMLYLDLTAQENLMVFARLAGVEDPKGRVAELLEAVDLTYRRGDVVRDFSRGMVQRLSLARALVADPELVLLDEPFTGLDPSAMAAVERLFSNDGQGGKDTPNPQRTIVMTSHDLARGYQVATHVLLLSQGREVVFSSCEELSQEELSRLYGECLAKGSR